MVGGAEKCRGENARGSWDGAPVTASRSAQPADPSEWPKGCFQYPSKGAEEPAFGITPF